MFFYVFMASRSTNDTILCNCVANSLVKNLVKRTFQMIGSGVSAVGFIAVLLPEGTHAFSTPWLDSLGTKSLFFSNRETGRLPFPNSLF